MNRISKTSAIYLCIAFLCSFSCYAYEADSCLIQKINQHLALFETDQQRLKYLDSMVYNTNGDGEYEYCRLEYELANKMGADEEMMRSLYNMARCLYYSSDYKESLEWAFKLLKLAEGRNNLDYLHGACTFIAFNYSTIGSTKSLEYYKRALNYAYQLNDDEKKLEILNSLCEEEANSKMFQDAFHSLEEIRAIIFSKDSVTDEELGDYYYLYGYLCLAHYTQNDDIEYLYRAKDVLYKSMKYYNSPTIPESSKKYICRIYTQLADAYNTESCIFEFGTDKWRNAIDSSRWSIFNGIASAEKHDMEISKFNMNLTKASLSIKTKQYTEAKAILDDMSSQIDVEDYSDYRLTYLSDEYINLYKSLSDYKNLSYWQNIRMKCLESTDDDEYRVSTSLVASEAEYENEKRQHEIERLAMESSAKWRMAVIALLGVCVIVFVYFWIRGKKQNKILNKQNDLLADQHEEIRVQNETLEQQKSVISKANEDMRGSMRYAKQIQEAVMPNAVQMQQLFSENMVFFRPLNIVSGDFYWIGSIGNARILAVGDCTGHGVPGAVLSMLGMSLLNDITATLQTEELSAAHILDLMNEKFQSTLRQTTDIQSNHDSIDIALTIVDSTKKQLHYAGAFRPLVMATAQGVTRIDADRQPIGVSDNTTPFTEHIIDYSDGDAIYMYSDGITDQFGFDKGRETKYNRNRLKALIATMWQQPMAEQKALFNQTIDQWTCNADGKVCRQLDDMVLVGVRV